MEASWGSFAYARGTCPGASPAPWGSARCLATRQRGLGPAGRKKTKYTAYRPKYDSYQTLCSFWTVVWWTFRVVWFTSPAQFESQVYVQEQDKQNVIFYHIKSSIPLLHAHLFVIWTIWSTYYYYTYTFVCLLTPKICNRNVKMHSVTMFRTTTEQP